MADFEKTPSPQWDEGRGGKVPGTLEVPGTWAVAFALFALTLVLYLSTLAPSVLEGDPALFQYAPFALAVTYPTGYPVYLLLGGLWISLFPFGDVAYRMNFLSALFGAVDVGLIYLLAVRAVKVRIPSMVVAAFFAVSPAFWEWAVVAKSYTLNIFFVSLMLLLLMRWQESRREGFLRAAALAYGFGLGNHSTLALFAPGLFLFLWLVERCFPLRRLVKLLPWLLLPLFLYLYIPWRGEFLLEREGSMEGLDVPLAVARGLVSSHYRSGAEGLAGYFLAHDFAGSWLAGWERVPTQVGIYWRLLLAEFAWPGIVLGLAGAGWMAYKKPRLFAPMLLIYITIVLFVLRYGQGQQAAFLLPGHLIFTLWVAEALAGLGLALKKLLGGREHLAQILVAGAFVFLPFWNLTQLFPEVDQSKNLNIRRYWEQILENHPLEEGAVLAAHWGDLTPLWYFQHAEGVRPDLAGLFPPDEETMRDVLRSGRALYLAGPLQNWSPGIESRFRMTPWGILVRVSLPGSKAALPAPEHSTQAVFGEEFILTGYEVEREQVLALFWRSIKATDSGYLVSLHLLDEDGREIAHREERLISAWYPVDHIPEGLPIMDIFALPVPQDAAPGRYWLEISLLSGDLTQELLAGEKRWRMDTPIIVE